MSSISEIFAAMKEAVNGKDAILLKKKFKGSVEFRISDTKEVFSLDLKSDKPSVTMGEIPKPDLRVTISKENMIKLANKQLKPQEAFMKGKLKIKGKMALAMKLNSVLAASRKYLPKARL